MKRIIILIAITSLVSSLAVSAALAQGRMQRPRAFENGQGPQSGRIYNPATVETISGEVTSINQLTPMGRGRGGSGVHLLVKTNKETIEVHLGPSWYLENQKFSVVSGDRLEIKGSRVNTPRGIILIAAQVKKGNDVLTLRNENGVPVWSGKCW